MTSFCTPLGQIKLPATWKICNKHINTHIKLYVFVHYFCGLVCFNRVIHSSVPRSIPGGVTWFFSDIFLPSDRTVALGSTQPLVKMSTRNISWGKGGRCVRLTTSPPSCAEYHETWEPKPPGTPSATPGLLREDLSTVQAYEFVVKIKQEVKVNWLSLMLENIGLSKHYACYK